MQNTILQDVKKYLGVPDDLVDDPFVDPVVMFINSAIDDLARIGLREIGEFRLEDKTETWEDYLGDRYSNLISTVKSYISIYVKLHWDSSQSSLQSALEQQLDKLEFTIQTTIEQMNEE